MKKAHEKYNNTIQWEFKFQTPEYGIHFPTVHKLACERKPNRFNTNSQKHKSTNSNLYYISCNIILAYIIV